MYTSLPTIEECQEFHRLINAGRVAAGLEPLDKLEFDACVPCSSTECLSATNLFTPVEIRVDVDYLCVTGDGGDTQRAVLAAVGCTTVSDYPTIPDAILAVTDPFDRKVPGLRQRLEEAGVV
jgi:hypothetical protein